VAESIVDWGYHSRRKTVARIVQRLIAVFIDGIVGPKTLAAINTWDQQKLFDTLKIERNVFLNNIIKRRPDQVVFYNGWMNRLKAFKYVATEEA
jgi:lysozyme family protein